MLKLRYDPVHGYDYVYNANRPYIPDYRIHRPYDFYFDWPWRYRVWFPNRPFRRFLNKELRVTEGSSLHHMLPLQYDLQTPSIPFRNVIDYEHVPYTKYFSVDSPNYSSYRPLHRYDKWPAWYNAYLPVPEFRHYLNNLLMRDLGITRHKYVHTYW
ncbi:hypothetical protein NQ317_004064 [Molorchus minor]|uniref:Uncharacterized protein n=1 Tax=Molorchus minor TaxID=1323400 RepID=A0ABQ9JM73_9CUCU|nr:hypothetical protein NQ317_004064 [Molorchus minor]